MTGFDGLSFTSLLQKFALLFDDYPLQDKHKSHPVEARSFERRSSKEGSPGGLSWRGSLAALQLIFGMTCSNLCIYLRLGRRTIGEALKSDSLAKIAIPSNEDIESYKETIDAMPIQPFSTFQDPCMKAKSHIGGECMISSVPCTTRPAGSALLLLISER